MNGRTQRQQPDRESPTLALRRFLAMPDDEPTELTMFCGGRISIAQATSKAAHIGLLAEAEHMPDFNGAYQLVNKMDPAIMARYPSNRIQRASNGRASDRDITSRRALFIDIDPVRPKGISATADEHDAARGVAHNIRDFLTRELGTDSSLGCGCSGNGFFILIAIEAQLVLKDDNAEIKHFLDLLNRKFGNAAVSVDKSVFNAARLMPSPGTTKRKGQDLPDRPHRPVTFSCRPTVSRVALKELV